MTKHTAPTMTSFGARGPLLASSLVRNMAMGQFLETFLVAAVTAILAIRAFLAATGYPRLGGGGLHIAHMLWGGLLMLLALVLLLAFLGRRIQALAALIGGVGFGTFIDELGKFITSDNNYFFQPTIALIYMLFVLLFLTFRALEYRQQFTPQERLANALDLVRDVALRQTTQADRAMAEQLLHDSTLPEPLRAALSRLLEQVEVVQPTSTSRLEQMRLQLQQRYRRLIQSPKFVRLLIGCLVLYAILFVLVLVLGGLGVALRDPLGVWRQRTLMTVDLCLLVSGSLVGSMLVLGAVALPQSRLRAYRWFKRAVLLSLLFVQVMLFYQQQLAALGWLALNLVLWSALNAMIAEEQSLPGREKETQDHP
ncbi:MAG: hypothetical protein ACXVCO_08010 [Ktedonobacterales bacterium]